MADDSPAYELGRRRGSVRQLTGRREYGGEFYTRGHTIEIIFPGLQGSIEESHCFQAFDVEAAETKDTVTISVVELVPAVQPPREIDGVPHLCGGALSFTKVDVTLKEPLGRRSLISGGSGQAVPVTQIATRLEPTLALDGWELENDWWFEGLRGTQTYGPAFVETSPITRLPRLHGLRQFGNYETITVRNENDGVITTRGERHRLGFEEMGWYYQIHAPTTINQDTLIEFARGFERPALTDSNESEG